LRPRAPPTRAPLAPQVGYWHVQSIQGGAASRVTYSAALLLKGWFPKPVVDFLISTTLGRATQWVGKEATARLAKARPTGAAPPAEKGNCWSLGPFRRCKKLPPPPPAPPPRPVESYNLFSYTNLAVIAMTIFLVTSTYIVI